MAGLGIDMLLAGTQLANAEEGIMELDEIIVTPEPEGVNENLCD